MSEALATVLAQTESSEQETEITESAPAVEKPADDASATGDTATGENADESNDDSSSTTYADFALPEGVSLNEGLLEQVTPLFKELGLNQDQAQKLVDFQAQQVQASQQGQIEAFNQLKTDWIEQAKKDSEIGGDKFEETVGTAKQAISKFGNEGLTKLLNEFGIGNHPEVIRFMAKVGTLTKEDVPDSGGSVNNGNKDHVSVLYPK